MSSPRPAKLARPIDVTEILPQSSGDVFGEELRPGDELGGYVVERVLGGGGGGMVYAARAQSSGARVAVKVLRAEMAVFPSMVTRFIREAEAVNRIAHPNIVTIHGVFELGPGRPYYVMELLEGVDLRVLLELHGRLSPQEVLALMTPICLAVQAAHDVGIVHRDIKANNVMIVEVGGERVVKLLDFGIAKILQGETAGNGLTEPGARIGTAHNMAPEQVRGECIDGRTDVYALGVLLFQLLTGEFPFPGSEPRQIALMHLQAPAPRPSTRAPLAPQLDEVVLRCLEKQPQNRYESPTALLAALRTAVGTVPSAPPDARHTALGIHVAVGVSDEELDDDSLLDDLCTVLDAFESALSSRGFRLPVRTSSALLGVRMLDDALDRDALEQELCALLDDLSVRPGRHPAIALCVSTATGEVTCRADTVGLDPTGGPLLETDGWSDLPDLRQLVGDDTRPPSDSAHTD